MSYPAQDPEPYIEFDYEPQEQEAEVRTKTLEALSIVVLQRALTAKFGGITDDGLFVIVGNLDIRH